MKYRNPKPSEVPSDILVAKDGSLSVRVPVTQPQAEIIMAWINLANAQTGKNLRHSEVLVHMLRTHLGKDFTDLKYYHQTNAKGVGYKVFETCHNEAREVMLDIQDNHDTSS